MPVVPGVATNSGHLSAAGGTTRFADDVYAPCASYVGYVGAAATGNGPGSCLLAGPRWDSATPDGMSGVIRSSTDVVGTLTRTQLHWTAPGYSAYCGISDTLGVCPDFSGSGFVYGQEELWRTARSMPNGANLTA